MAGHITPQAQDKPVLTISLARMNRLLDIDKTSQIATFEPGANGPELEAQLKPHGYVLGHYPQSFELSTIGGWVATRSSGQQSWRYGRIEQLFAGGILETFDGPLEIPTFPASSAGPDLREIVLGSEGTFRDHQRSESARDAGARLRTFSRRLHPQLGRVHRISAQSGTAEDTAFHAAPIQRGRNRHSTRACGSTQGHCMA